MSREAITLRGLSHAVYRPSPISCAVEGSGTSNGQHLTIANTVGTTSGLNCAYFVLVRRNKRDYYGSEGWEFESLRAH